MRWQFLATVESGSGSYEVEFRRLDEPGGGLDYDQIIAVLNQILRDLEARVNKAKADAADRGEWQPLHLPGDDGGSN